MGKIVLGALLGLVLAGVGAFWWQGRAQVEQGAPPPEPASEELNRAAQLPSAEVDPDLRGPEPPEATELTREERRFFRYDRNRDRRITRNEMLSTRTNAFRKLDVDGNNLLSFEEWAVATAKRFEGADADGDRELSPAEFLTTRPKRTARRSGCKC